MTLVPEEIHFAEKCLWSPRSLGAANASRELGPLYVRGSWEVSCVRAPSTDILSFRMLVGRPLSQIRALGAPGWLSG